MLEKIIAVFLAAIMLSAFAFAQSQITVAEIKPTFAGKNLKIELLLFNRGDADGNVTIKFILQDKPFDPVFDTVAKNSSKKIIYNLEKVSPGSIIAGILSDENKFFEIIVPENPVQNTILAFREIGSAKFAEAEKSKNELEKLINELVSAFKKDPVLFGGVLIFGIIAFYLIAVTFFRKKTKIEKQQESNEVLLQELEEINQVRKQEIKK